MNRHRNLCKLVKSINSFLSPLVFTWILFTIYFLSIQVNSKLIILITMSFIRINILLHFILCEQLYKAISGVAALGIPLFYFTAHVGIEMTIFAVAILSAAKVNTNAVRILNILRNCPKEMYYETDVCRLEHQVTTGPPIGFTGMGCFSITRRFILSAINVIFTMEIILLQSAQSPPPIPTKNSDLILLRNNSSNNTFN